MSMAMPKQFVILSANFNIDVEMEGANVGPRVTQYTLKPPTGVKLTKITALENNLALDLAAHAIRMEAPIPGKRAVGIEVPNVKPAIVALESILQSRGLDRIQKVHLHLLSVKTLAVSRSLPTWLKCPIFWSLARPVQVSRS